MVISDDKLLYIVAITQEVCGTASQWSSGEARGRGLEGAEAVCIRCVQILTTQMRLGFENFAHLILDQYTLHGGG